MAKSFLLLIQQRLCLYNKQIKEMRKILNEILSGDKENDIKMSAECLGPFVLSYEGDYGLQVFKKYSDWNQDERAKYVFLIQYQKSRIEKKEHKKLWEIYQYMAKIIGTRNYLQCKLYHQKMLKQYGNIDKIISCLTREDPEVERKAQNLKEKLVKFRRSKDAQKQIPKQQTADSYFQQFQEEANPLLKIGYREDPVNQCQRRAQFWLNKFKNISLPCVWI